MAQIKNVLFGKLAVSTRFITEEQLQECLEFQKEFEERGEKPPRLGEILEQKGYLTKQQIQSILETMSSMQRRRFGEIAVAFHFITLEQLETCLDIQRLLQAPQETVPLFGQALVTYRNFLKQVLGGGHHPKIGEILVAMGYMRGHQVDAVSEEQNKRIVRCKSCEASLNISRFEPGQKIKCGQCNAVLEIVKVEGKDELDVAIPAEASHTQALSASMIDEAMAEESLGGVPEPPTPGGLEQLDPKTALLEVEREFASRRTSPEVIQTKKAAAAAKSPGRIADFQVVTRLGQDSTGVIFKATQISKNRPVALKIMNPSVMNDKTFQKRFVEEAKKVASLDHPNIKKVYSLGKSDARFYIAMEFVEAESVYNILEKQGKFQFETGCNIAVSIAEALKYAQERGLIHGDLRPSNILILRDGNVKLANLGLATKITENILAISRSGQMAPFYIAPECVTGDREMDHRTDIYSLGATLFHMIAGRPPFQGQSPFEVLVRLTEETIPPLKFFDPTIPDNVCRIVERMLEAEPQDRYQSYDELLNDLRIVTMSAGLAAGAPPAAAQRPGSGIRPPSSILPATGPGAAAAAAAGMQTIIRTPEEMKKEYDIRTARAARLRTLRRSSLAIAVVVLIGGGAFYTNKYLQDEERKASYRDVSTKWLRQKSSPIEYDHARAAFNSFAQEYPATYEAADAMRQLSSLDALEEGSRSDELELLLKGCRARIAESRFLEALEFTGTGSFYEKSAPELATIAGEVKVAADADWRRVVDAAIKRAEEKKQYEFAKNDIAEAIKGRQLEGDDLKAIDAIAEIDKIRKKHDDADIAANEAKKEGISLAVWTKGEEQVRKLLQRLEYVTAQQQINGMLPSLMAKHQDLAKRVMAHAEYLQEFKNQVALDIKETMIKSSSDPRSDSRVRWKNASGIEMRAFTSDDGGVTFVDPGNVSSQETITWSALDNRILIAFYDRLLARKDSPKYFFAAGYSALLRAETADVSMKSFLMKSAEDRLGRAAAAGLADDANPFLTIARNYFDETVRQLVAGMATDAQQQRWGDGKDKYRTLVNTFPTRIAVYDKEIDATAQKLLEAGAEGGEFNSFSSGKVGNWKSGPGAVVTAGVLKLSGTKEVLEYPVPGGGCQTLSCFFRFDRTDIKFTLDMGPIEFLMYPQDGSEKFDVRVMKEEGGLEKQFSVKNKLNDLRPKTWHHVEVRQTGANGGFAAEIFVNGASLTVVPLKRPLTTANLRVEGKSAVATGEVFVDGLFVR